MSTAPKTLTEFLNRYDPHGKRTITEITPERDADGNSPFIVVRHGRFAAVLALMPFDDHLCIDVFAFTDGEDATTGIFGMSNGQRWRFPVTGTTSHGWNSVHTVALLIGEQNSTRNEG